MIRPLLLLLAIVVIGGYLGTLIARDPGYVLVTYEEYSLQTSLWVMLGMLLGFSVLFYLLAKLFRWTRLSPSMLRDWRSNRRATKANQLTNKGMMLLSEGEHVRAKRFLEGGLADCSTPGLTHLALARVAEALGDGTARESNLRLAEEANPGLKRARQVVTAELALQRGDSEAALLILKDLKPNTHTLKLKQAALTLNQSWKETLASVKEIRKTEPQKALEMEIEAARMGMFAYANDDGALNELFKSLTSDAKQSVQVLTAYARSLGNSKHAEPVIRARIKKEWLPELVKLYGELDESTLKARQKSAENWLKKHPDDAALQFCLGCIYHQAGEDNLARECLQKSIDLGGGAEANEKLAAILADSGEFERSTEQLRIAMQARS